MGSIDKDCKCIPSFNIKNILLKAFVSELK